MSNANDWFGRSPTIALIVVFVFSIGSGVLDFIKFKDAMFLILGFVNIILMGAIGLLQLPKDYIAMKGANSVADWILYFLLSIDELSFDQHAFI
jgi:hypothetical protein